MIRFFILMAAFTTLTGCVSPMALQDQAPGASYANPNKVLIAVIDERSRVEEGKNLHFAHNKYQSSPMKHTALINIKPFI